MDFQALMAQAAHNTASSARKIGDHRSRATTNSASTPTSGKMSAEVRQAAVQAQLTKISATPLHSSNSVSSGDARKSSSSATPSGSKKQCRTAAVPSKPANAPPAPITAVDSDSQPLFRTISDRKASNISSVAAELLREKRENAIAELKAAKHRPPSPREPRVKTSSSPNQAASASHSSSSSSSNSSSRSKPRSGNLPDSLSVPAMEYSRSSSVPEMAPPSKVRRSRDDSHHSGRKEHGHSRSKEDRHAGSKDDRHAGSKDHGHSRSKEDRHAGSKDDRHAGSKDHGHSRSKEDRHAGSKDNRHAGSKDHGHSSSRHNGHSSSPTPVKPKRPVIKSKTKPMDYASLLNAAQANARKVDNPSAAVVAQSRLVEKKRPPSDDDEPAGKFLLEGPRRVFDKTQVHIKALRTSGEQVQAAPSASSRSAPQSAKSVPTSPAAASRLEAFRHAGHSQAKSAHHIRTLDSSTRASSLDSRMPSKQHSKATSSESRMTSSDSRAPSSNSSRSTPSSGDAHPAQRKALTQSTIFGDAVASRQRPSLSASGATQQSHMDSYFAESGDRKATAHKTKPLQSRMDTYYESSNRDVPKAASNALARSSKAAASKVPVSGADKRSSPGNDESAPKKKKAKKKFGPIWMQEEWSDEDEPEADDVDVSKYIRRLYGYDRRRFADEDPRDLPMESSWSHIQKEEKMSARLGRQEDLEQERLEEEERKRSEARRKRRRIADDDDDDD